MLSSPSAAVRARLGPNRTIKGNTMAEDKRPNFICSCGRRKAKIAGIFRCGACNPEHFANHPALLAELTSSTASSVAEHVR